MGTLSLRTQKKHDEQLDLLCKTWGVNRSVATRRAIEETAKRVPKKKKSKMQILRDRGLIGAYSEGSDKSIKERYREALREKYGR